MLRYALILSFAWLCCSTVWAYADRPSISSPNPTNPVKLQTEPLFSTTGSLAPRSDVPTSFQRQFGIGISVIPAKFLFLIDPRGVGIAYAGGLQLDLLGRFLPYLTGELSFGALGFRGVNDAYTFEFDVSAGLRFYLKHLDLKHQISFHPYLVTALRFDLWHISGNFDSLLHINEDSAVFGFVPGIGLEFRYKQHFAFQLDFRTLLGGSRSYPSRSFQFITGVSANLGASYYF